MTDRPHPDPHALQEGRAPGFDAGEQRQAPPSARTDEQAREEARRRALEQPPPAAEGGTGPPASDARRPSGGTDAEKAFEELRPAEVVRRLDEYIVGQAAAKRAVAVALRNRIRRLRIPDDFRHEVLPKNILMIGPTGVGKTEIARRLARMTRSPFIKVEATKFTEVGYVGRDVESIVRDLLEQTINEVHEARIAEVEDRARELAEERIIDALIDAQQRTAAEKAERRSARSQQAAATPPATVAEEEDEEEVAEALGMPGGEESDGATPAPVAHVPEPATAPDAAPTAPTAAPAPGAAPAAGPEADLRRRRLERRKLRRLLDSRRLEEREVEIEVEEPFQPAVEGFSGTGFEDMGATLSDFFSQLAPPRRRQKRMTVADARDVLVEEETDRLIDMDRVYDDAIHAVEESGIVFVDEVDKIAGQGSEHGPDVSGEGVQRDLLPLLEGSTVHTRYGAVRTDHILYIAAGAFTMSRPGDLIPEFQGRFPIRVELSALTEADLQRILVEPQNALTKQHAALLATEGVTVEFPEDGLAEIARQAFLINDEDTNIGARRLFTVLEKVLEELSFHADEHAGSTVVVGAAFVRERLGDLVRNEDLRRYVL